MIRAVIDTNVVVSGLIRPTGNEALVLLAAGQGLVRPCLTAAILAEYRAVLARPRFGFAPAEVARVIDMLCGRADLVEAGLGAGGVLPDADDEAFVACAIAAGAAFIVTGNRRHFPEPRYGTAQVVNAGQLLAHIAQSV